MILPLLIKILLTQECRGVDTNCTPGNVKPIVSDGTVFNERQTNRRFFKHKFEIFLKEKIKINTSSYS